jgi:hypothetical protein
VPSSKRRFQAFGMANLKINHSFRLSQVAVEQPEVPHDAKKQSSSLCRNKLVRFFNDGLLHNAGPSVVRFFQGHWQRMAKPTRLNRLSSSILHYSASGIFQGKNARQLLNNLE